ncbi:hypothetical protein [Chitinophaga parva]|nr:hypothetical protein [Chitinophaga parva]
MDTGQIMVVAATGLVTVTLVVLEWRRARKARLGWRLLATLVALASLLALALPLRIPATDTLQADKVLVLTEGFDADTVRALYQPHTPVYATDSVSWVRGRRWQAQWMPFPGNWPQPGRTVHVTGSGLESWQRGHIRYVFHPAPVRDGITHLHWNQQMPGGAALRVQGQFQSRRPLKVLLYGLNAPLDSATASPFTLTTRPKHRGGAVYRLITLQGKDTLSNDPLPVFVTAADTLNVLLLAAVPDAENRFLKDWLGSHGSKVAVRTVISRGKADQAFMNQDKKEAGNAGNFAPYDLVVADAAALQSLPMATLNGLRRQVEEGMGLLVKTDSGQGSTGFYNSGIVLQTLPPGESIRLPQAVPLKDEQAVYMKPGAAQQPLISDEKGRVFCAVTPYGRGNILHTTLHNTYTWQLASHPDDYDRLWAMLLHTIAREKPVSMEWRTGTAFPLQDAPVLLQAYSTEMPVDASFSFARNSDIPFLWACMQWPRRSGWQYGPQGQVWYVYGRGDWATLRARERTTATAALAGSGDTASIAQTPEGRPVPPLWPFLAFLLAAGFLWVERKL